MQFIQTYQVAAANFDVEIGHPQANVQSILKTVQQIDANLIVFPELCLTGYTCQDLFFEQALLDQALLSLRELEMKLAPNKAVIVGLPIQIRNHLYNGAAFIANNEVKGIQLKVHLPNYNEFYEKRWFQSGIQTQLNWYNRTIPVGTDLLFEDTNHHAIIGIEICEDLWVNIPVSSYHANRGANILCNLSASNEAIAKKAYREDIIKVQSAKCQAAYIYASANASESTSDLVFSGHCLIYENGKALANVQDTNGQTIVQATIDLAILASERARYHEGLANDCGQTIPFKTAQIDRYDRPVSKLPFVPEQAKIERCQTILTLQAQGLATRLKKIHCQQVVVGISGGLDSTLALLVCAKAFELVNLDPKGIHTVTMPGFGTSTRTKTNATQLMELLGTTSHTISIVDSVTQHLHDLNHPLDVYDITYENAQARMRTQILMNLANQVNGLVIGTGDLSELALGWCTYNGDHMSMYAVNASIPKTLITHLVQTQSLYYRQIHREDISTILDDICDTPVSPELLPLDESGNIQQKTEAVLGSYQLHDFFLYYVLRYHMTPSKILHLAAKAFDCPIDEIKPVLITFYRRFFTQQFKRNCMPDAVKVGSICLSPRGDWRMPSDASVSLWLAELEQA